MKLVLFSGGQARTNKRIHMALADLIGDKQHKSLTYIPFCHDGSEVFFNRMVRRYRKMGFTRFYCLPVDVTVPKAKTAKALKADAIYLAGGNTFYFLQHLKKSGLLPRLRRFVARGGVLGGLSAGAIIMTPHIKLAGYPKFDADENEVRLKDFRSLHLVPFEFFPHFGDYTRINKALASYSRRSRYPVYACRDGSAIVVNGDHMRILGKVHLFQKGKKIKLARDLVFHYKKPT